MGKNVLPHAKKRLTDYATHPLYTEPVLKIFKDYRQQGRQLYNRKRKPDAPPGMVCPRAHACMHAWRARVLVHARVACARACVECVACRAGLALRPQSPMSLSLLFESLCRCR